MADDTGDLKPIHSKVLLIAKLIELAKEFIKYGAYVWGAYFAAEVLIAWSGKKTEASLVFKYITSEENGYAAPWIVATIAVLYAIFERNLRKRKTQYFEKYILQLESKIDPERTSSQLLPTGETNPKDKI